MKRFNLSVVFIASLVVFVSHVSSLQSENIVGGDIAMIDRFPYQVSLQVDNTHICGGSLIAPNLVLTAGHCVLDGRGNFFDWPYFVVAGTDNNKIRTYGTPVTTIYTHKKYKVTANAAVFNDIAVLKLKESFDTSGHLPIRVISLPKRNKNIFGKVAVFSGYGLDDNVTIITDAATKQRKNRGTSTGLLRFGEVVIVQSELCGATVDQVCGLINHSSRHGGACSGDSGGPLVLNNEVIGIASSSPLGCDESREPGSYTIVSHFLDFITNVMNNRQTDEMNIRQINYGYNEIPSMDIAGSTTSSKLQKLLAYFQIF